MQTLRTYAYPLFLVLVLLACYGYFVPKSGDSDWVANSRANLVFAVVNHGVLHIDAYHTNTGDKAFYNEHYYTPTSIGPSLVALPPYAIFALFRPEPLTDPLDNRWDLAWITFFAVSLPSALVALLIFWMVAHYVGSQQIALLVALIYGLATIAFPYSKAFFQHQVAAFGMVSAWYLLWRHRVVRPLAPGWFWLIGALMSLALISEYPVFFPLAFILLWAIATRLDWRLLMRIVGGGVPLMLIFSAYNLLTFGAITPTGYRYHVLHNDIHGQGLMGIISPDLWVLWALLFSPARGLLFISPVLLLTLLGLWLLLRQPGEWRRIGLLISSMALYFLLYNAAYLFWTGGYSVGPRYLVPLLPFLMLPLGLVCARLWTHWAGRALVLGLSLLSLLLVWTHTIAGQYYYSDALQNPLREYVLPVLASGDLALNYGILLGLPGWWSLLPLVAVVAALTAGLIWVEQQVPQVH
jgi:hypothetical protein